MVEGWAGLQAGQQAEIEVEVVVRLKLKLSHLAGVGVWTGL